MAADIFGGGLDRNIDAILKSAKEQRRGPGIVYYHQRAARMRLVGDRRHILYFECEGAGRLYKHGPRSRLKQLHNAGADHGIVIARRESAALEPGIEELACGMIDAIADQQVVAAHPQREKLGR